MSFFLWYCLSCKYFGQRTGKCPTGISSKKSLHVFLRIGAWLISELSVIKGYPLIYRGHIGSVIGYNSIKRICLSALIRLTSAQNKESKELTEDLRRRNIGLHKLGGSLGAISK